MTAPAVARTSADAAFSFAVPRSAFAEALGRVKSASGGVMPILKCVLVSVADGAVSLETTNLDHRIVTTLTGVAASGRGGVAIPLARLLAVVTGFAASTPVTVTVSGRAAKLVCGKAKVDLVCLDAEEWPGDDRWHGTTATVPVDGRALAQALTRVKDHVSTAASRPVLGGVLLEGSADGLFVVGSDNTTLSAVQLAAEAAFRGEWILPAPAVAVIASLFAKDEAVTIETDSQAVRITGPTATLTSRLLEGPYPPYRQIMKIASIAFTVDVDRLALLRAVRSAAAVATNNVKKILMQFRADAIDVWSESADAGRAEDSIPASRTVQVPPGKQFVNYTAFAFENLRATLDSFACETVRLTYQGAERALHVADANAPATTPTRGLIMPLRVCEDVTEGVEVSHG